MPTAIRFAIIAAVLLVAPGCVSQAAKTQVAKTAAAHEVYTGLVESTFDGTIKAEDGQPVTADELAKTPASVKTLLTNVIRALYLSRKGWVQLDFALNDAADPSTLDLEAPALPE